MKEKSIGSNMLLNVIRKAVSAVFPLVTFIYASRVLGVNNIGKFNFSNSIVGYFSLIAGLGIYSYAVREGVAYRNDSKSISNFASQMFSINLFATFISYFLLILTVTCSAKLQPYKFLILIISSQIILETFGVEWIYTIYEDYVHITIRSIIVCAVSIISLIIFVKDEDDLLAYAFIFVISSFGTNIFNLLFVKKHCKFGFTTKIEWKKHISSILVLFSMTLAITVYVNSDITILGLLLGDKEVGLYSVSAKVYTFINGLIGAAIAVGIPKISYFITLSDKQKLNEVINTIQSIIYTFSIPAVFGIIFLRKEIIFLSAGVKYLAAASPLAILAISLFFCANAYFWGQCVLVPLKKEKCVFFITVVCALFNIVLNFILIPYLGTVAAALTTAISECIAFLYCYVKGNKIIHLKINYSLIIKTLIGCIPIAIITLTLKKVIENIFWFTGLSVIISIALFITTEAILKQEIIYNIMCIIVKKLKQMRAAYS